MNSAWNLLAEAGRKTEFPRSIKERQESWLRRCLARNRNSAYLQSHGISTDTPPEAFRRQLPLVHYGDLAGNIGRIEQGEENILFDGRPIAFERTGGSAGGNKLIPYTTDSLSDFRNAVLPWLSDIILANGITSGSAYWAISPATRPAETTPSGIPVELVDGAYLGSDMMHIFAELSAVPAWAGSVPDMADWQLVTLYYLSCADDLALISVWSPTFFLALLDALQQRHAELGLLLRQGGDIAGHRLPKNEAALARLNAFLANNKAALLWPALSLVSCWADASSKPFFDELRQRLPHARLQGKGLLSTEGVTTIPDRNGLPILAADSGFFEFLDDENTPHFAWELHAGKSYEAVMTTSGGLYRYRSGDCVRCEGYSADLPILRFEGRLGLTSDLVGEKLTEDFVAGCLADIPGFRMLVPVIQAKPRYVLVVDGRTATGQPSLARQVEMRLSNNSQYAYARHLGQLDAVSLAPVERPLDTFIGRMGRSGSRLGDIKVTSLRPETDWLDTYMKVAQ